MKLTGKFKVWQPEVKQGTYGDFLTLNLSAGRKRKDSEVYDNLNVSAIISGYLVDNFRNLQEQDEIFL